MRMWELPRTVGPAGELIGAYLTIILIMLAFIVPWVFRAQYAAALTTALALVGGAFSGYAMRDGAVARTRVFRSIGREFHGRRGLLWLAAGVAITALGATGLTGFGREPWVEGMAGGVAWLAIALIVTTKRVLRETTK